MLNIGVDSGGTFTDAVAVSDGSRLAVGKALSTPARPADGVINSLDAVAGELHQSLEELLAQASIVAHGTTVGLNALLTGRVAATGLITTSGFEDTLAIARINKAHGLSEELETQATLWEKPPALLPPSAIRGVTERVDAQGRVVVELDELGARQAIRELVGQGVSTIAVCLLWSFVNPGHELRLAELIAQEAGTEMPVTLSSELAPRIGEYERMTTVMLNACLVPAVSAYVEDLGAQLGDRGFAGSLLVMRSGGGVQPATQLARRPVETLRSGPVGGLSGAGALGRRLHHPNIICTDVGGTSFDVGLIVAGAGQYARRPMIGRYAIASPLIDIESIGTGGGSIASYDEAAGTLRVGPESAAADPGPACYARGGTRPTVTDAAAALGYVDRLGGELVLDVEAARRALAGEIGDPLGLSITDAAEGILQVAAAQMADLIRRVTIQRGFDPREFVLYAFGGAAPQYAGRYAMELGVDEVVVPVFSAVFSAFGAIAGELRTSAQLDAPQPFPTPPGWMQARLDELEARVREQFAGPVASSDLQIERSVGLRFRRQVHELSLPLAPGELTGDLLDGLAAEFTAEYERLFGEGTAYAVAGIELVGLRVEASFPLGVQVPDRPRPDRTDPIGERAAIFDGREVACPVYDGDTIAVGMPVTGPAMIEVPTTTTVVYPGQTATVDAIGNTLLRVA
jgi:N-methylhydantoinase A